MSSNYARSHREVLLARTLPAVSAIPQFASPIVARSKLPKRRKLILRLLELESRRSDEDGCVVKTSRKERADCVQFTWTTTDWKGKRRLLRARKVFAENSIFRFEDSAIGTSFVRGQFWAADGRTEGKRMKGWEDHCNCVPTRLVGNFVYGKQNHLQRIRRFRSMSPI